MLSTCSVQADTVLYWGHFALSHLLYVCAHTDTKSSGNLNVFIYFLHYLDHPYYERQNDATSVSFTALPRRTLLHVYFRPIAFAFKALHIIFKPADHLSATDIEVLLSLFLFLSGHWSSTTFLPCCIYNTQFYSCKSVHPSSYWFV